MKISLPTAHRTSLLSCALLLPLATSALPTAPAFAADPPPDPRLATARRGERAGWILVHLEGSPGQVGYQHGYLLAEEIKDLLRVIKPFLEHSTKRNWDFYRDAGRTMLWDRIDEEYKQEIDGIVEGLKARGVAADRWDILALCANQELPYYYVPWLDRKAGNTPATHAPGNCSAFIATGSATRDGKIVMGHNAWTNYVVGSRWNVVFDIKPEKGARFIMDGLPGVITSDDDFGLSSNGIMITETTITQFEGWDPAGKAEFARARKALQYAHSIDEVVAIMLDGNNGGYANDWLIGDTKTGEIALFELGLKNHSLKRTKDGCYFGANYPESPKLRAEETKFDATRTDSSPLARKTRWEQLVSRAKGAIDVQKGQEFETDVFDVIDRKHGANERTLCGRVEISPRGVPEWDWTPYFPGGTVQAKVADAAMTARLEFWGQIGHNGSDFIAADFLKSHPEYDWMKGLLRDMKAQPWARLSAP